MILSVRVFFGDESRLFSHVSCLSVREKCLTLGHGQAGRSPEKRPAVYIKAQQVISAL